MRPLQLYLENFGSFREATTIDFSDVDYFALLGPTGAGKSTVLDGICFALYGTVPRWGKENVIAYALAPSAIAGKVALVFETGGRRHAAIRALQRSARGVVQTKEAMLYELDPAVPPGSPLDDVLAAAVGAVAEGEQVTAAVEQVTGLAYKFFTQCVVLPQGRFAEFLHAPPRQRQDLLVRLLDAEVYEEVRKRAGSAETAAAQAAEPAESRLASLTSADEAAEERAVRRVTALRELAAVVGTELDALREHEAELTARQEESSAIRRGLTTLTGLAMPPEVPELAAELRAASAQAETCEAESATADAAEHAADEALGELGDEAALTRELDGHDARERLMGRIVATEQELATASDELGPLAGELVAAQEALRHAEQELERFRTAAAGAALSRHLTVGEPCPTCLQIVRELPAHEPQGEISNAEVLVARCRNDVDQAVRRHRKAEGTVELRTGDLRELREDLDRLPQPSTPRPEVEQRLASIARAKESVLSARAEARAARNRLTAARRRLESLRGNTGRHWQEVGAARDQVVALGAPPLPREDLQEAWQSLLAWRDQAAESQRSELARAEANVAEAESRRDADRARIDTLLTDVDVPPNAGAKAIHIELATATASAQQRLEQIREDRSQAADLTIVIQEKRHEAQVAHELANLLRANAFERWLCEEALDLLVTAGSETLRELSDGQYELAFSRSGEIEVIDYAEAGMRRNIRTLSGGETFQAALALALALSEQVSGLAAAAARSLESIFLDEGFGTLDPVTLDTVATTLERLATNTDRMVGIVTHVPALADRVPVRFEVTRDVKGSHLRKVGP